MCKVKEKKYRPEAEEQGTIYISSHAMSRLKERNGWSRKTSLRMLAKVYDDGIRFDAMNGRLARWINRKISNGYPGDEFVVYGEYLYIFNGNTLITVIKTPKKNSFFGNKGNGRPPIKERYDSYLEAA